MRTQKEAILSHVRLVDMDEGSLWNRPHGHPMTALNLQKGFHIYTLGSMLYTKPTRVNNGLDFL